MSEMLEKARKYEFTQGQQIKAEDRPAFHITPYVGWMNALGLSPGSIGTRPGLR